MAFGKTFLASSLSISTCCSTSCRKQLNKNVNWRNQYIKDYDHKPLKASDVNLYTMKMWTLIFTNVNQGHGQWGEVAKSPSSLGVPPIHCANYHRFNMFMLTHTLYNIIYCLFPILLIRLALYRFCYIPHFPVFYSICYLLNIQNLQTQQNFVELKILSFFSDRNNRKISLNCEPTCREIIWQQQVFREIWKTVFKKFWKKFKKYFKSL